MKGFQQHRFLVSLSSSVVLLLLAALQTTEVFQVVQANELSTEYLGNKQLLKRIEKWTKDPDGTAQIYGAIRNWDTSNVTSLRNLFSFQQYFNDDIGSWNVAKVTDFSSTFWEANAFDVDLGAWDVQRAETMACMFCGASSYTGQGLSKWKQSLGNVEDMFNMFEGTALSSDTVDLSEWQTASVTNFRQMFMGTPNYNVQLCWNVSVLARTNDMFNESEACFQSECVVDHVLADAGCSEEDATSSSKWLFGSGAAATASISSSMSVMVVSVMVAGLVSLGFL